MAWEAFPVYLTEEDEPTQAQMAELYDAVAERLSVAEWSVDEDYLAEAKCSPLYVRTIRYTRSGSGQTPVTQRLDLALADVSGQYIRAVGTDEIQPENMAPWPPDPPSAPNEHSLLSTALADLGVARLGGASPISGRIRTRTQLNVIRRMAQLLRYRRHQPSSPAIWLSRPAGTPMATWAGAKNLFLGRTPDLITGGPLFRAGEAGLTGSGGFTIYGNTANWQLEVPAVYARGYDLLGVETAMVAGDHVFVGSTTEWLDIPPATFTVTIEGQTQAVTSREVPVISPSSYDFSAYDPHYLTFPDLDKVGLITGQLRWTGWDDGDALDEFQPPAAGGSSLHRVISMTRRGVSGPVTPRILLAAHFTHPFEELE